MTYCLTYEGKNISNDEEFLADPVNTPENDVE